MKRRNGFKIVRDNTARMTDRDAIRVDNVAEGVVSRDIGAAKTMSLYDNVCEGAVNRRRRYTTVCGQEWRSSKQHYEQAAECHIM